MAVKAKKKSNPNGANQFLADPRQTAFLGYYFDPKSTTYSNAMQSAMRAGYEEAYAKNITAKMPTWLLENAGKMKMLAKAERNLDKMLDLETLIPVIAIFGPVMDKVTGKPLLKENTGLLKIKSDVSQFIAERLGRITYGKDDGRQGNVYNLNIFSNEQAERIARRVLDDRQESETVSS